MQRFFAPAVAVVIFAACSSGEPRETPSPTTRAQHSVADDAVLSEECAQAFEGAAAVDNMSDTHEDMDAALIACATLEEFEAGSAAYPAALDDAEPETYARNRCLYSDNDAVKGSSLCAELIERE